VALRDSNLRTFQRGEKRAKGDGFLPEVKGDEEEESSDGGRKNWSFWEVPKRKRGFFFGRGGDSAKALVAPGVRCAGEVRARKEGGEVKKWPPAKNGAHHRGGITPKRRIVYSKEGQFANGARKRLSFAAKGSGVQEVSCYEGDRIEQGRVAATEEHSGSVVILKKKAA